MFGAAAVDSCTEAFLFWHRRFGATTEGGFKCLCTKSSIPHSQMLTEAKKWAGPVSESTPRSLRGCRTLEMGRRSNRRYCARLYFAVIAPLDIGVILIAR